MSYDLTLSDLEQLVARRMAELRDKGPNALARPSQLADQFGVNLKEIQSVVQRFAGYGLVEWETNESVRMNLSIVELIHQLDNPPAPDYWKALYRWWFKSRWRVAITVIGVVLPLLVQWKEMIQQPFEWILGQK